MSTMVMVEGLFETSHPPFFSLIHHLENLPRRRKSQIIKIKKFQILVKYKKFGQIREPKSILKPQSSSHQPTGKEKTMAYPEPAGHKVHLSNLPDPPAFSETVIERKT
ncbi:hypothetical protein ScPMuIL_000150 [Solemya velum]